MKLKNKLTGEIINNNGISFVEGNYKTYSSLAELTSEWEDVEEDEYYYAITSIKADDGITKMKNKHNDMTAFDKSIGNYFSSREEAEKAVEKLKAWKRLKDKGFRFKGWKFAPDMKQIEGNYVKIEAEVPQILINKKDLDLLFGGEE